MILQLLWLASLALAAALAWRAMEQGGPPAGWLWWTIGAIALLVFGGEIISAAPRLLKAIRLEEAFGEAPRLHWHVAGLALLVAFRPHRPRAVRKQDPRPAKPSAAKPAVPAGRR